MHLRPTVHSQKAKALYEAALKQSGHFTTQQAIAAGFKENTHPYHVRQGNWTRIERGLYRLAVFPESRIGKLTAIYLWSRNRKQKPQGTFSHLTALELHTIFDRPGDRVFMTVPRSFRRSARTPVAVLLYKEELGVSEVVEILGLPVTTVKRTLADVAAASLLQPDELRTISQQQLADGAVDAQFVSALLGDQFQFRF